MSKTLEFGQRITGILGVNQRTSQLVLDKSHFSPFQISLFLSMCIAKHFLELDDEVFILSNN
jgi:hypothetical protein